MPASGGARANPHCALRARPPQQSGVTAGGERFWDLRGPPWLSPGCLPRAGAVERDAHRVPRRATGGTMAREARPGVLRTLQVRTHPSRRHVSWVEQGEGVHPGKMAREPPRAPPASGIVQTARGSTARDAPSGDRRAVPTVSPGATANAPGVDGPSHVVGTPHFRSRDPTLALAGLSGFGRFFASAFFPTSFSLATLVALPVHLTRPHSPYSLVLLRSNSLPQG